MNPVDEAMHGGSVRSYARRGGRLTRAQRRALETEWGRFGLGGDGLLDLDAVFARRAPRVVEVGFGMGDALLELSAARPDTDFLGIEVYEAGIGRVLNEVARSGIANVRLARGDAVAVLSERVPDASLDALLLFFPDPWPKTRHHKRRLVQPAFAALVASKLAPGGRFQLATDWEPYAEHMLEVLGAAPGLVNAHGHGRFAPRPLDRPRTKFERRGERLGHEIRDLVYERAPPPARTS